MLHTDIVKLIKELNQRNTWIIAYSGGLDSHVLLHLMQSLAQEYCLNLQAVHINHQISTQAKQWAKHCESVCRALNIPCTTVSINLNVQPGESLEAKAREQRYAALAQSIAPNDVLLTAHHQDDQAETMLLQLLRGAGPKGLAAMPIKRTLGRGWHCRPLLTVQRSALLNYAQKHNLQWIDDESNQQLRFDRNFIRHQILPLLSARWPHVMGNLSRAAQHCADADTLLTDLAQLDSNTSGHTIDITALKALSTKRRYNALRQWIATHHFTLPDHKQLQSIDDMLFTRDDSQPQVCIKGYEVRRFRDALHLFAALKDHNPQQIIAWDCQSDLTLPNDLGVLLADRIRPLLPIDTDLKAISVRFRQGGERLRLPGHDVTHSLKQLLQEWRIPPWQRNRIPLIFHHQQLVVVACGAYIEQYSGEKFSNLSKAVENPI